jgi:alpha-tubulin suppressor-like RCC1 family protein
MAHTCAVTAAGSVACWGSNAAGQLGNGTKTASATPVAVTLPGGALATRVATGLRHSCAVTTTGEAYCWGSNMQAQLGDSTITDRLTPTAVKLPAGVRAVEVSAGSASTCIVDDAGAAWCWGMNAVGQVGDGTTGDNRRVPTAVALPAGSVVHELSLGEHHACVATESGTAYCWGDNGAGQIGDGVVVDVRPSPIAVALPEGLNAARVATGARHSCATTTTGIIYCWGLNTEGQIGTGSTTASMIRMPAAVPLP